MEHVIPLIQTLLWVSLIASLVWHFHLPINGILVALQKRIESGSSIKAGPFEITDQLRPQEPEQQRRKASEELEDALKEIGAEKGASANRVDVIPARIHAKHCHAEDLVLRAIQVEQGVTISRQVTAGSDMGFDGVFVAQGSLNIVEVKYARSLASLPRFKSSVERLNLAIARYGWRRVQIILAVVFDKQEDMARAKNILQELAWSSTVPLTVRCYLYDALKTKFGAEVL